MMTWDGLKAIKEIGGGHIEWLPFRLTLYYYVWTVTTFQLLQIYIIIYIL